MLNARGDAYRRFTVDEIAALQTFDPQLTHVNGLTNRQLIASIGDAVPPRLSSVLLRAVEESWRFNNRTALEICAGMGGLAEGASSIGLEHIALIDMSPICVALLKNERGWDPDAVHLSDVRAFNYAPFKGRVGLLSGGPPCQPWSQSGRHLGHDDDRDLLLHLDEIVSVVEPEVFLFENVPGLASGANEQYLTAVVEKLRRPRSGLSYGVMVALLQAADFGVPQTRERIFIAGFRGEPNSAASRFFDRVALLQTHRAPTVAEPGRLSWVTVGDVLENMPDPGGWRRWIGTVK